MTDKVQKIREEVEKRFEQIKNSKRESDSCAFYQLKELLEFIDSMQEEPKKCMYSKDDYTDEDRKVLCDGCKEECKYSKSDDFTIALAECIHQAQGNVVDPMVHAETWKDELIKLSKGEKSVSEELKNIELLPELKESDDERTWLINYLSNRILNSSIIAENENLKKAIAWLERQGEQKLNGTFINADDVREEFMQQVYRILDADATNDRANQIIDAFDDLPSVVYSNQGEQPSTDKVEPKFKIGDWVVSPTGVYWHIDRIENNRYEVTSDTGKCADWSLDTDLYHLWTIEDAKDGDVLELDCGIGIFKDKCIDGYNIHCYCYYSNEGVLEINKDSLYDTYQSHPATKEQRDTLEKAITEAGYEWDAEHKQLNKIEQNHVIEMKTPEESLGVDSDTYNKIVDECVYGEQKTAWSEEDENLLNLSLDNIAELKDRFGEEYGRVGDCIKWLKSIKERVQPQPRQEWSEEDRKIIIELIGIFESAVDGGYVDIPYRLIKDYIRVLKSCSPQNTWKPSEEQMKALEYYIEKGFIDKEGVFGKRIVELYAQLKKLREE